MLEAGAVLWSRRQWAPFGFASLTIGVIFSAIAAASGFVAEEAATQLDAAGETAMALHHTLSLTSVGLAGVLWFARWWMPTAILATLARRRTYAVAMILLVACMVGAAYFGGELVFEHGVGTAVRTPISPR